VNFPKLAKQIFRERAGRQTHAPSRGVHAYLVASAPLENDRVQVDASDLQSMLTSDLLLHETI
jgi:hypothetical protein